MPLHCVCAIWCCLYWVFGVSWVGFGCCGSGGSWTVASSEICNLRSGTTALVSWDIRCARSWSTGPVCILATWQIFNFRGFPFLLKASPFFFWICWSWDKSGTVFLDTKVVSIGGGISIWSTWWVNCSTGAVPSSSSSMQMTSSAGISSVFWHGSGLRWGLVSFWGLH